MSQYYYTIASLPFLSYETDPPLSMDEFIDVCKKECKKSDFSLIKNITLSNVNSQNKHYVLYNQYQTWERSLRNELVLLRAKKIGTNPEKYLHEGEQVFEPAQTARSAFLNDSPLNAEKTIDKARWMYLEQLEVGHFFDIEKLIIYKLKLEILLQKAKTKTEKGRENFNKIMEHFTEELLSLENKNE